MTGSPTHAAYPENGKNPSETLARLILEVENITREFRRQGKIVRMTVIGVEIGSNSYGMSASEGEVRFTIRGSPFDADDHTYKVFGTDKGANYSSYSNFQLL